MLTWVIISACLTAIFLGIAIIGRYSYDCGKGASYIIFVIGWVFEIISASSLGSSIACYQVYNDEYNKHIADVISVSRDSNHYFYSFQTEKGLTMEAVSVWNTYVIETDEYVPSIYKIKEYHTLKAYYNLYVPYGTIVTTYTLD